MAPLLSLPVGRARPARLPDVQGPASVLPVDEWDFPFIVAGAGESAVACFLGSQYTFVGMPLAQAGNYKGLAIEGVEFDLELGGAHSLEAGRPAAGAVVLSGDTLQLVYKAEERYPGLQRAALITGLEAASAGTEFAFHAWRAHITVGDLKVEVWRKDAP